MTVCNHLPTRPPGRRTTIGSHNVALRGPVTPFVSCCRGRRKARRTALRSRGSTAGACLPAYHSCAANRVRARSGRSPQSRPHLRPAGTARRNRRSHQTRSAGAGTALEKDSKSGPSGPAQANGACPGTADGRCGCTDKTVNHAAQNRCHCPRFELKASTAPT